MSVREFDDRYLFSATRNGQIKKTALEAYSRPRKGGIQATGLAPGDQVIGVSITRGDDEIVLGTRKGQAIRFKEQDVRVMGRTAAGVKGIKLRKDDKVVDMIIVDKMATLLTVCENGYGKRTDFEQYRLQTRGGMGIINIRANERNGSVVGLKSVKNIDEMMLISHKGKIIRAAISSLRTIGRATQGVRVISLKKGDTLVAIASVAIEDEDKQSQLPLEGDVAEE
jgi:DNA gyrase subunit A